MSAEYEFDTDPAIKEFTWLELIKYNISFLRGEKKNTFYHASPLEPGQDTEHLIAIHKRGIFTDGGQDAETITGINDDGVAYTVKQKAYLEAYLPLSIASQVLYGARRDDQVIFELVIIQNSNPIYVSDEMVTLFNEEKGVSLTKEREDTGAWEYITNFWGFEEDSLTNMTNIKFTLWNEWVKDGLCFLMIIDKEYDQAPKSMPTRILGYLDEKTDYPIEGGRRNLRRTRKKSMKP